MKERPILFSGPMVRAILEGRKTQTRRIVKCQPPDDVAQITISRYHPTVIDRLGDEAPGAEIFGAYSDDGDWGCKSPFGEPGDRLWVRETWKPRVSHSCALDACDCADVWVDYQAAGDGVYFPEQKIDENWTMPEAAMKGRWIPSIHMPRWASRIMLEITGVRVERMQSISEADAIAEGAVYTDFGIELPKGSISLDGGRTFHPVVRGTQRNGWHMGDATSHERCMGSARYAFANLINRLHGGENWNLKGPGLWEANPWVWVVEVRRVEK
ncbi:hypothetical protein [Burkholderia cenocepacia]|uniref:hypothetical protein n=1 Tax=Burkholderia cenocepacia TaxID=95486 RepID=UPI001F5B3ADE|nr:hypothetical protein [Burkholderia cenocepacia]